MINLILCGGSGTRLWPISRSLMPKQFARLFDGASLFQRTVKTNSRICNAQYIVSNAEQYFLAKDQLEEVHAENARFLLEPVGRNTAPAIALACLGLNSDDIVLVSPSDHVIRKADAYEECLQKAEVFAKQGFLVTAISKRMVKTFNVLSKSRIWKRQRSMSNLGSSSGTVASSASRFRRSLKNLLRIRRIS